MTHRHGFLHQATALCNESRSVCKIQHPCRYQRSVFAETVAGHCERLLFKPFIEHTHYGDPGAQQRRLRVLGLVKLLFRSFLTERPEIDAQCIRTLFKGRANHGVVFSEVGQHPNCL